MLRSIARIVTAILLAGLFTITSTGANANDDGRIGLFHAKISPDGTQASFTWQGDIWVADIATGQCHRVTDNVAYDHHAVWFPDGKRLAFSSSRDGNDDIYSVPVTGGEPTRHTWYASGDGAMGVSPDGSKILFRSSRRVYSIDLYEVDLKGGLPKPITNDQGWNLEAGYSPDGSKIAVCRGGTNWVRRFYHGADDTDIYVMNRDGSNMRWVENGYDGMDYWPNYDPTGKYIYFVSDRELNTENVFRIPSEGGPAERITSFKGRPVGWLSISNAGRLCFTQDFHLWIMDPGGEPRMVNLNCATDPKRSQEERLDLGGYITEMELSPNGANLALISRGDLFITKLHRPDDKAPLGDVRFDEAIRVTNTPSREQHVAWHPDGDKVVLVSDKDGNQELYEIDLRTFEWKRLTNTSEEEYYPQYSPDGTKLAYYHGKSEMVIRNIETGKETVAVRDLLVEFPGMSNYGWSPDSRWIAYNGNDSGNAWDVFVVKVEADGSVGKPVNITVYHDYDYFSGWAKNGKDIYFLSDRNVSYGLNGWGSWAYGASLFTVPLQHIPLPLSDRLVFPDKPVKDKDKENAKADTLPATEEKSEKDKEKDKLEVKIDFPRIEERARLVSPTKLGGWIAMLSPDSKTFVYESSALGKSALWKVPFEGGSADLIASTPSGVADLEWIPDNSGALFLTGGRVNFWESGSGNVMGVPTYGRLRVDLRAERRQMILEAGMVLKDNFYDPSLHNTDWNSVIALYEPLAEDAMTPEEFELLLEMMFGELNASHLGSYGDSSFEGIGANTGVLGLDFDPFTTGPGLHVTDVWPRGPADYDESRIKVGEWVLKIEGTDVSTSMNYYKLLDDAGDRRIVLTVASDQKGKDSREVKIEPLPWNGGSSLRPGWYDAMYRAWVDKNRKKVEDRSGGKVGYIHIQGMSGGPLEEFARELFSENSDKDALVLDCRFNTGGNTHETLLNILETQQFGYARDRDGKMLPQPTRIWQKPIVLLVNEYSFSDSEIFPSGFKILHLGTVMGNTTAGGVIGTVEYGLIDGKTYMRIPRIGWYTIDMKDMENLGIKPDIIVQQDLNHLRDGIDDQLNAAVDYLLKVKGE